MLPTDLRIWAGAGSGLSKWWFFVYTLFYSSARLLLTVPIGFPATDPFGSQRLVSGGFTSPSILARQSVEGLSFFRHLRPPQVVPKGSKTTPYVDNFDLSDILFSGRVRFPPCLYSTYGPSPTDPPRRPKRDETGRWGVSCRISSAFVN